MPYILEHFLLNEFVKYCFMASNIKSVSEDMFLSNNPSCPYSGSLKSLDEIVSS